MYTNGVTDIVPRHVHYVGSLDYSENKIKSSCEGGTGLILPESKYFEDEETGITRLKFSRVPAALSVEDVLENWM